MPTVPVIESLTNSSSTGTSMVVNMPASPTVGNLLVMVFGYYSTFTAGGLTAWTELQRRTVSSQYGGAMYWRQVDGTEPSTYTVTGWVSGETRNCTVLEISGHNGIDVSALNFSTSSSSSWTSPSVTTTVNDGLLIRQAFTGQTSKTGSWAWVGTETVLTDFYTDNQSSGNFWGRQTLVTFPAPTAGSQGTVTITPPVSNSYCVMTVAIKPLVISVVNGADTGSGSDTSATAVSSPVADTTAGADTATARAFATATDASSAATESSFVISPVSGADTGSSTSNAVLGNVSEVRASDVRTIVDSATASVQTLPTATDTSHGIDTGMLVIVFQPIPPTRRVRVKPEDRTTHIPSEP